MVLAMIESGLNPKAYSRANASGMWQFIYSTGKNYGLKRDWYIDERRDIIKATHAACEYLKDGPRSCGRETGPGRREAGPSCGSTRRR